jgi:hypothetical protein
METQVEVIGDAEATASRIIASESLYIRGIQVKLLIGLIEIVITGFLYALFKPVNE